MNIKSLLEKIDLFEELINESGFARDVREAVNSISLPDIQNSLVALKSIAQDVLKDLERLEASPLKEALSILLPETDNFLETKFVSEIYEIINNPNIDTSTFHAALSQSLNRLNSGIKSDSNKLNSLKTVLQPYSATLDEGQLDDDYVVSLLFRDKQSIKTLNSFSVVLKNWHKTLNFYQRLIRNSPPKDARLLEIQEGSIDVLFAVDVDLAQCIRDLALVGLTAFGIYLRNRSTKNQTEPSPLRTDRIIELENELSKAYLAEVRNAVRAKLEQQHQEARNRDPNIREEGLDSMYNDITLRFTDHIINGNEIKLIAPPPSEDGHESDSEDRFSETRELREKTLEINDLARSLTPNQRRLLISGIKAIGTDPPASA